jgi:hypothetical protein
MNPELSKHLQSVKQRGNTSVTIEFSGGGDSGGIDTVNADATALTEPERLVLMTWAYSLLDEHVGDFINGAGGYGNLEIDLEKGEIIVHSYIRTETYDFTTIDFELPPTHEASLRDKLGR